MIRVKLPGLVVGLAIWCGTRSLCQAEPGCEPPVAARASMAAVEVPNALRAHFARRGEHKCAVAAFRLALRVGPHSAETRLDPGFGLIESGDLRDAVAELWKFSRRSPGFFQARTAYGTAHSLLGEHPAAVEEFTAARHLSPQLVDAALRLRTRRGQSVGQERLIRTSESYPNCDRAGALGDLALALASARDWPQDAHEIGGSCPS